MIIGGMAVRLPPAADLKGCQQPQANTNGSAEK